MNRTAGVIKMHMRDKWSWMIVPWLILLTSFAVNLVIGALMNNEEPFISGGIASLFVYIFVAILIVQGQTFPFALGMSIRRTDYFLGTAVMGTAVCAISSILLFLFSVAENLTGHWGVNLQYFNLPFLSAVSPIGRIGIYFDTMLHLFFLGFVISGIYRRFGKNGMFVFFTALFIIFSIASLALTYFNHWVTIFSWLGNHYMSLFLWLIPLTVIYALLSFGLIRRATV